MPTHKTLHVLYPGLLLLRYVVFSCFPPGSHRISFTFVLSMCHQSHQVSICVSAHSIPYLYPTFNTSDSTETHERGRPYCVLHFANCPCLYAPIRIRILRKIDGLVSPLPSDSNVAEPPQDNLTTAGVQKTAPHTNAQAAAPPHRQQRPSCRNTAQAAWSCRMATSPVSCMLPNSPFYTRRRALL